jgi:hypothetical protein
MDEVDGYYGLWLLRWWWKFRVSTVSGNKNKVHFIEKFSQQQTNRIIWDPRRNYKVSDVRHPAAPKGDVIWRLQNFQCIAKKSLHLFTRSTS